MTTAEIICAAVLAISMPRAEFACEHMQTIVEASAEHNIDPIALTALIHIESRYYGYARKNIKMALCAYNAGYICTKYKNKKRIKYPDKVLRYSKKIKIWYDKWVESLKEMPGCSHNEGS